MYYMPRKTVTIRIAPETRKALDVIATTLDLDRSHVVNEALVAYIETHRWQLQHIHQGFRQAMSGDLFRNLKQTNASPACGVNNCLDS